MHIETALVHIWEVEEALILPCGRMVAPHRRGAAPPGDEVLRGHGREQQRELQRGGGRQLRHDGVRWMWKVVGPGSKIKKNQSECDAWAIPVKTKQHREGFYAHVKVWFDT